MSDRIAAIRARLDAASIDDSDWPSAEYWESERPEDAALIAHAPADLSWLLAEVDAMRVVIGALHAGVRELEAVIGIASAAGNDDPQGTVYQDRADYEQMRTTMVVASTPMCSCGANG